jgi:hypothetical protein
MTPDKLVRSDGGNGGGDRGPDGTSQPSETVFVLLGSGADDGIRTRDPHLGKVVLYQLSHVRVLSLSYEPLSGASTGSPKAGCQTTGPEKVLGALSSRTIMKSSSSTTKPSA